MDSPVYKLYNTFVNLLRSHERNILSIQWYFRPGVSNSISLRATLHNKNHIKNQTRVVCWHALFNQVKYLWQYYWISFFFCCHIFVIFLAVFNIVVAFSDICCFLTTFCSFFPMFLLHCVHKALQKSAKKRFLSYHRIKQNKDFVFNSMATTQLTHSNLFLHPEYENSLKVSKSAKLCFECHVMTVWINSFPSFWFGEQLGKK